MGSQFHDPPEAGNLPGWKTTFSTFEYPAIPDESEERISSLVMRRSRAIPKVHAPVIMVSIFAPVKLRKTYVGPARMGA
jgi:hypothetical protein